ncbi:TPA: host specificity protein J [Kluyvera ascorbata]
MDKKKSVKGRKGGSSSSRTPTEQPDDLQSVAKAKLLIALGEGEFAGGLTAKEIYLDGTALENADGSSNFSGVAWEFRSGTQAQQYIQGIPGTENEVSLGTEVSSATAWTRTFTNTLISAVRLRIKWPSIYKQQDNVDLVGYTINYAIDLQTDGGTWKTVLSTRVSGKTTTGYERSHRIDLPQAGSTWTLRLRKTTGDANSAKIGDTMTLQSYTEVIDAKLRYPNTALLYIEFDSSQFNGSIPQISCEPKMRVIRVPDNYDPETRSYLGTWTGAFKWAWTDNPAWVFYDLVLSDRFGLGNRLTAANIDKWSLYEVAQYCDQMVPDGKGGDGTEPRYTCNVYVQDRNDAYTVLRDFAAIFRGMTYWGGDQIVALADMPRDIDFSYTRANVVDGLFTYASSTTKTRYTTALVSWSDPDNAYADAMEPVFEQQLVARYGFNQLEMTAIGCTRQSEANRKGRWGILTNNKDRVVTFSVGLDGNIPQPGYIIAVADELLSGKVTGGRIRSVNGRVIELDRVADAAAGDRLILNLPSGAAQSRTIQAINGNKITVTTAFSETPEAECVWVVESDELYAQQYRVVSVSDNNDGTFTISGAAHDPDKYARIDTGAIIDQRPVSVIPPGNQSAPADIAIESYSTVQQGISVETLRATWSVVDNAIAYEAQWRRDDGNWVNVPRSSTTSFEVESIYAGRYLVRVRAINAAEISSGWGYSEEVTLTGKVGNPPQPVGFVATPINWGIRLNWGFPANTSDTLKTEIQYTPNGDQSDPLLLSDVPYPSSEYIQLGLKAGQEFWFRAQLVDKTGNESGWTGWIRGMANDNADDYLGDITGDFLTSKDGDALTSQIDQNLEGQLQNALANNATVERQWAQYGEVRAEILVVKTTIASVDKAMAELSTTVQAELGDMTATLEDKLTAVVDADGASAIHTLKVGVRIDDVYYGAGMSVAVVAEAGQPVVTRIAFNANQLVLLSGEGDAQYSPFAVINGQMFVSEGFIQYGEITLAKIGELRSSNYVEGKTGTIMKADGTFEINGGVEGEGGMKITNTTQSVKDGNNVLRVQIGKITGVF